MFLGQNLSTARFRQRRCPQTLISCSAVSKHTLWIDFWVTFYPGSYMVSSYGPYITRSMSAGHRGCFDGTPRISRGLSEAAPEPALHLQPHRMVEDSMRAQESPIGSHHETRHERWMVGLTGVRQFQTGVRQFRQGSDSSDRGPTVRQSEERRGARSSGLEMVCGVLRAPSHIFTHYSHVSTPYSQLIHS